MDVKENWISFIHDLQNRICSALEEVDGKATFFEDAWKRPEGGGGKTRVIANGNVFEKGGVNTSIVFGDVTDAMRTQLKIDGAKWFACGLSLVIHPINPFVPTVHCNYRMFELYNEKDEVIKQKEEQLKTAYFVMGSKKDLKRKGIIESRGGILGLGAASTVNQNLNKSELASLNKEVVTSIPVGIKKAKLLSAHPVSSYTINLEGNEITTLEIIDPDDFWRNSKYLVLQTN